MKQRPFRLLLLLLITQLLIDACCGRLLEHTEVTEIQMLNTNLFEEIADSATVVQDSFRIRTIVSLDLVANHGLNDFSNIAYATSCPTPGLEGLKSKITNFEISCNQEILGIEAGQALNSNDNLKAYLHESGDDSANERISVNDWLEVFNLGGLDQFHGYWYFEFQKPIESAEYLKFFFRMETEDGAVFESETEYVKIE